MTSRIIFQDTTWTITQDPTGYGRDDLVRFRCHNGRRCLLDQIAAWDGSVWSPRRWLPQSSSKVPAAILAKIEAYMRKHGQPEAHWTRQEQP